MSHILSLNGNLSVLRVTPRSLTADRVIPITMHVIQVAFRHLTINVRQLLFCTIPQLSADNERGDAVWVQLSRLRTAARVLQRPTELEVLHPGLYAEMPVFYFSFKIENMVTKTQVSYGVNGIQLTLYNRDNDYTR